MKPDAAFGAVLQTLRRERGLSQERIAEMTKLDRTFISLLERGRRQPSLQTILRISSALEITGSELIQRVEQMLTSNDKQA